MDYEIYIDIVFLINFLMDFSILWLVSSMFHYPVTLIRKLLGAGAGALGICMILVLPVFLTMPGYLIAAVFLSILMVFLTFRPSTFRLFLKQLACLYMMTFLLGGVMNWILWGTKAGYYLQSLLLNSDGAGIGIKNFLWITLASFLCIKGVGMAVGRLHKDGRMLLSVMFDFEGVSVTTIGLVDTGNGLVDPMTGKPVIVSEYQVIKKAIPKKYQDFIEEYLKKEVIEYEKMEKDALYLIRFIPFESVGKKNGKMVGVNCKHCTLRLENRVWQQDNIIVALTEQQLSGEGEFFALLPPDFTAHAELE